MPRNPFVSRQATKAYARADEQAYGKPLEYMSGEKAPGGVRGLVTPSPRDAQRIWQDAMLAELRQLVQTSTDAFARANGSQIMNSVLDVGTYLFPADGQLVRDYHVAVGSIFVINTGTSAVTCQSGTHAGGAAPATGRGVTPIPAGSFIGVPIGAHAFTLWGTTGQPVAIQVFTGMQAYGVAR